MIGEKRVVRRRPHKAIDKEPCARPPQLPDFPMWSRGMRIKQAGVAGGALWPEPSAGAEAKIWKRRDGDAYQWARVIWWRVLLL
jgi:hypothetical protein